MKILIHALGANMGGAVRHLNNFIPSLIEKHNSDNYILILRSDAEFNFENQCLQIMRIPKVVGSNFLIRTFFDLFILPLLSGRLKVDLVISLLNFGPVFLTKPHINFQRNALFFCPDYIKSLKGAEKIQSNLRSALLFLTMKYSSIIVTPSNSMVELIKKKYPSLNSKHFVTLYHGFSILSKETVNNHLTKILAEDKRVKILYPTHPAPHKGFEVLFEALSKLKKNVSNFVLYTTIEKKDWPSVVGKYEEQIRQLSIEENVIFTGRIPQNQMQIFYKNCDLMVYPSLCESFGFSMVEAMGYGLPIVAADTEINKEICKDAAIYYSASASDDAAEKLFTAFDDQVRNKLKEAAQKRMLSFDWSWERYVNQFLTLLDNI